MRGLCARSSVLGSGGRSEVARSPQEPWSERQLTFREPATSKHRRVSREHRTDQETEARTTQVKGRKKVRDRTESTTRLRGFLFLSLGIRSHGGPCKYRAGDEGGGPRLLGIEGTPSDGQVPKKERNSFLHEPPGVRDRRADMEMPFPFDGTVHA